MATLRSKTFTRDPKVRDRLQRCANVDPGHISEKDDPVGDHVSAIHAALVALVPAHGILDNELQNGIYGPTTAAAVFKFKDTPALNGTGKKILRSGQNTPDRIVGIQSIAALDSELRKKEPGPDVPPPPLPPAGKFKFIPVKAPLLIKSGADDPTNQDLENAPVNRTFATLKSKGLASALGQGGPSEAKCKSNLRVIISVGGSQARDMAEFFFTNQQLPPGFFRDFKTGSFFATQVAKDSSFTTNHANLSAAILAALQELADGSPLDPAVVDINKLADGSSFQPKVFADFANDIDFSFQRDRSRIAGDPLAFAIGSIQGLEVRITDFTGQPNGSYQGKLQYILVDHFGANDSDVIDPGQASLWLLQRKMADGQSTPGCEPYRVRITVDGVVFSGQLT